MDYDSLIKAMSDKRQELGQRIAESPDIESRIRADLFGGDRTLNSLRDNEAAKIKELYEHDKGLAVAFQGGPEGFIDDPGSVARYGHQNLRSRAGELADIQSGVAKRRDVLGDSLAKALKRIELEMQAKENELKALQEEFSMRMELDRFRESQKSGSGKANLLPDLLKQITGFQEEAGRVSTKGATYTTNRKVGKGVSKSQLISDIKKRPEFKGKQINYTQNKNGTITATAMESGQGFLPANTDRKTAKLYEDPQATVNKMAAAGIAAGISPSDISSVLEYLGLSTETEDPTTSEAKTSERNEIIATLQQQQAANPNVDPNQLFIAYRQNAQHLSDSEIKSLMRASGFIVF